MRRNSSAFSALVTVISIAPAFAAAYGLAAVTFSGNLRAIFTLSDVISIAIQSFWDLATILFVTTIATILINDLHSTRPFDETPESYSFYFRLRIKIERLKPIFQRRHQRAFVMIALFAGLSAITALFRNPYGASSDSDHLRIFDAMGALVITIATIGAFACFDGVGTTYRIRSIKRMVRHHFIVFLITSVVISASFFGADRGRDIRKGNGADVAVRTCKTDGFVEARLIATLSGGALYYSNNTSWFASWDCLQDVIFKSP